MKENQLREVQQNQITLSDGGKSAKIISFLNFI